MVVQLNIRDGCEFGKSVNGGVNFVGRYFLQLMW